MMPPSMSKTLIVVTKSDQKGQPFSFACIPCWHIVLQRSLSHMTPTQRGVKESCERKCNSNEIDPLLLGGP
jgi:hypothetical protein